MALRSNWQGVVEVSYKDVESIPAVIEFIFQFVVSIGVGEVDGDGVII